ncbi:hypothetical protein B0A55_04273 [Friedmanniomyces simplex]|uniref:Uncharacterized protein n=1 Tax=Friedmanniomyces simplex TaxID=329884 RepID=A0A4U0X9W1_9PEZI|nr:hypothetical protein B0A55_04273 [Friedmanniomyces simplex]
MDAAGGRYPFMRSTKRSYAQMSGSHRDSDASSSSLFLPHDDHYDNEHAARRPRLALPPMRASPARFAGDGLDYRRPVMGNVTSAAAAPVIDLTGEDYTHNTNSHERGAGSAVQPATSSSRASRLPRFGGRDIVDVPSDLDGDTEDEHNENVRRWANRDHQPYRAATRRARPQFSQLRRPARFGRTTPLLGVDMDGELEIVSERTLSRQVSPAPVQRSITPFPVNRNAPFVDLTQDDDVVLVSARQREGSGINAARPGMAAGVGTRGNAVHHGFGLGGIAGMLQHGGRLAQRLGLAGYDDQSELDRDFLPSVSPQPERRPHGHGYHLGQAASLTAPLNVAYMAQTGDFRGMPGAMMYDAPAFDMGLAGGNRPLSPKYEPPASPGEGFTRNPGEDEVVVCPNCGDELAVSEDEMKQEVWVVKGCGHAYCGMCARHRSKTASKKRGKGKERVTEADVSLAPPFSKCVIEGCGKNVKASQMVRVYFGS